MQAPTLNRITQTKHGEFSAVDYSFEPDPTIYAPEDGVVTSYTSDSKCGNNLKFRSLDGLHRHGFCHLESADVKAGDKIRRGQVLGVMGYTGYTIPMGPNGRHLHWVVSLNGVYVYPPMLINEPFKKGDIVLEDGELDRLIKGMLGREPTAEELGNQDFKNNPGLAIQTLWENGGKQRFANPNPKFKKVTKELYERE